MIDQTLARGRDAVNDSAGFPPPNHPKDRIVSGALILAIGFILLLGALALGLVGLGIIAWGIASFLAAFSPWRK